MSDTVILLVDDEKTILDSLRQQIRGLFGSALICETAECVEEAWEVLDELMEENSGRVILIVSDWLMPRVKGDEFLAEVRHRHPAISRVLLTGQADAEAIERIREQRLVDALLFKPWDADELAGAVSRALRG